MRTAFLKQKTHLLIACRLNKGKRILTVGL